MSNMVENRDLFTLLKKLAKVSKATLGGVACFFVKNGAVISSGLNFNPTGEPMEELVEGRLVSRPEVIHAEVAAIRAAADNAVDLSGATMLLTMSPCVKCAGEIAKTGIAELQYLYEWWDKAGLNIVQEAGINVEQLKEA